MRIRRSVHGPCHLVVTAVVLWVAAAGVGCSPVLTSQEVDAVGQFADATKSYGTFPGAAIKALAHARKDRVELQAAAFDVRTENNTVRSEAAGEAFENLRKGVETDRKLLTAADQADLQLKVLETYATLLQELTSDKPLDELDRSATELSNSIDRTVNEYYALFHKGLSAAPNFGSTVAEGVRGAGGIYIRYRQQKLLKASVIAADPIVGDITKDIEVMMTPFIEPRAGGKSYFDAENDFLHAAAMGLPAGANRLTLEQVQLLNAAATDVATGQTLAKSAREAAGKYRAAHAELVKAVNHEADLKDVLASIATLRDEVAAARELKKKIDADNEKKSYWCPSVTGGGSKRTTVKR